MVQICLCTTVIADHAECLFSDINLSHPARARFVCTVRFGLAKTQKRAASICRAIHKSSWEVWNPSFKKGSKKKIRKEAGDDCQ